MSFYGTHTEIHRLTRERDERDAKIARLRADLETARRQLWRDWVEGGSEGARQAFEATAHPR